MAADPNECRDHNEAAVIPGLHRSLQKLQQMFEQWIARESGSECSLYLASLDITFGGQLPSIFLGSQTAPHGRELLLGEGHPGTATLTGYLDEAWFDARSDLAGELELH